MRHSSTGERRIPFKRCAQTVASRYLCSAVVLFVLGTSQSALAAPIVIHTIQQLDSIGVDPLMPLSGSYELGEDIDASGFDFTPIGSNPFNGGAAFRGTFDGKGHTIDGLSINASSSDYVGLFGYVIGYAGAPGTVKNVHLRNATVVGNGTVGGLVGYSDTGRISNVSITGSVTGTSSVGGLIGGGGHYYGNSSLTNSYSTAIVTGSSEVGGLVGGGGFDILNSYAIGAVSGSSNVGGIAAIDEGTVSSSYAAGAVTGGSNVGGLLGVPGASVTNSYWDSQATGQSTSAGGTSMTTAELQSGALPGGFDPAVWTTTVGDYPTLITNPSPPVAELVDPVSALLQGDKVTSDIDALATKGRTVSGVSADGVTRLLIRIRAQVGDNVTFTVFNGLEAPSTSIEDDGGLADPINSPGDNSFANAITVETQQTTLRGPMAFALYRAPTDFVRSWSGTDSQAKSRGVMIRVSSQSGSEASLFSILVLRPPIVFIHGLWSESGDWADFSPLLNDQRFAEFFVDYSHDIDITNSSPSYKLRCQDVLCAFSVPLTQVSGNSLGIRFNASSSVLPQLKGFLRNFRNGQNPVLREVAGVQADLVAHSMGGDIARQVSSLPSSYDATFAAGPIHKLVTIGTPHLGTPLATDLLQPGNSCVRGLLANGVGSLFGGQHAFVDVTLSNGDKISGAVNDLQGDLNGRNLSLELVALQAGTHSVPTAMVAGVIGQSQLSAVDTSGAGAKILAFCPDDSLARNLTGNRWPTIVGEDSDAIVPLRSQQNNSAQDNPEAASLQVTGVIHSRGAESLGFAGPGELEGSGQETVPVLVTKLLNTPATSSDYVCVPGNAKLSCK